MEKSKMFCVASLGNDIVLGFWNTTVDVTKNEGPRWTFFQARRTAPGEYITGRGKTGKFDEKILTEAQAAAYVKSQSEKPAVKAAKNEFPFRVCDESRAMVKGMQAAGVDENTILTAVKAAFPLKAEKTEKKSIFAGL